MKLFTKGGIDIRKGLTLLFIGLFSLFILADSKAAESKSIQQIIDTAKPGETIVLTGGEYNENVIIDKPLHLIGDEGVHFVQQGSEPIITIQSNGVLIENLTLTYVDDDKEAAAILINGDHNELSNIHIQTNSYGVQLDEANDNKLSHLNIVGNKEEESFSQRIHGIFVWQSHHNEIRDTEIKHVQDGIYMEGSNENYIHHNTITQSRYGYHLMFTENTVLEHNESYENVSGMMIMGTNGTVAKQNLLSHNQKNIQSLGLLLYDVRNADVSNNDITYNRIGIFIEDASTNEIYTNNVQGNYIGLQFKNAKDNTIYHNAFIANVAQGQAEESSDNNLDNNFWGDHQGLDLMGDNTSTLPYKVEPFFLNLTNRYPPFQLLFQSPGIVLLEQVIHTPMDEQLVDYSPLMENPLSFTDSQSANQVTVLLFSLSLLFISILIMYMGVKKDEKG